MSPLSPVLIDKIQVQQVLLNLIRNSIEAVQSQPRRELTITTLKDGNRQVEFSISDNGPGLSPEVMSRLFQPFVTTKDKGIGSGLSICQSIIEAHDGSIWATPNDGSGVTFHVRLPTANG